MLEIVTMGIIRAQYYGNYGRVVRARADINTGVNNTRFLELITTLCRGLHTPATAPSGVQVGINLKLPH